MWTGPFLGPAIGVGFGNAGNSVSGKDLFCTSSFCPTPFIAQDFIVPGATSNGASIGGGAQVGYNWQFNEHFVFGGVADIMAFDRSGSATRTKSFGPISNITETDTHTDSFRHDWLATIRLRVGPAFDNLWIYGTGGLALGDLKSSSSSVVTWSDPFLPPPQVVASGYGSTSGVALGYAVGAGAEYKFARNWSIFAEYLYYSLRQTYTVTVTGNSSCSQLCPGAIVPASYNVEAKVNGSLVKLGLNYTFQSQ